MANHIAMHGLQRGQAAVFSVAFEDPADPDTLFVSPPLAAGDIRISINGGAFANPATPAVVLPAPSPGVRLTFSGAEMNGENILILCEDQDAPEIWVPLIITIHTTVVDTDQLVRSTTPANTLDVAAGGEVGLDFDNINDAAGGHTLANITVPTVTALTNHTAQTGDSFARLGAPIAASISADIAVADANIDTILVDTNELQGEWANGGRLDLLIDAILADTLSLEGTKIPDAVLSLALIRTEVLAALDTAIGGAPVADSINQRVRSLDLLLEAAGDGDAAAILTDTGELQTDWANGGRLDLLIDSIIDTITGTPGVSLLLTQAYTEGQTARTVGGSLELSEAVERNRITVTGGSRTLFQSNGSTALITRAQTATSLG